MKLNQALSWKFLIPIGIIFWIVLYGGIFQIIGVLMTIFGIIDLVRSIIRKNKAQKPSEPEGKFGSGKFGQSKFGS